MIIHSYPKVHTIGHKQIESLFEDEVIIEEKLDGSQISWCVLNGELHCRSKGTEIFVSHPEKMFERAVDVLKKFQPFFREGYVYRSEYLRNPKHNTLCYARAPKNNIIIFDISSDIENEKYLSYQEKKEECNRLGFEIVPCLHIGKVTSPTALKMLLETTSILGGQKIEGFICKNYSKFTPDGKTMMGKYVSEAFKEVHQSEWKKNNPGKGDIIQLLISEYKTIPRWNKSIIHMKERGEFTNSPKDIGPLIAAIKNDIREECVEEIKEKLYNHFIDAILRGSTAGFPEYFKQQLLESAFEERKNES